MRRPSPLTIALVWCGLLVAGGVAGMVAGYAAVARTLDVFDQVPALVSGGIGGIALVISGCVLAYVQIGRACAELERDHAETTLSRIGALAEVERHRIAETEASAPKPRARRAAVKQGAA